MFYPDTCETIPSNLDQLQPGPELGGVLACIDVDDVSPYDKVIVLRAHARQRSFHDAEYYRAIASVARDLEDDHPQHAFDAAAAEIQCALNLTRRATETEVAFALELQSRLPRVWEALFDGMIDLRRAKTFSYNTSHLSAAVAGQVVDRVIDAASELTTGELKARLERVAIEADPDSAKDRYEHRIKDRRLVAESTPEGTGNLLGLDLPPHLVNAISRDINHRARSLKTGDETRTMDQLRADVYLDLLVANHRDNTGGGVHLRVDLDTLTALSEHPGELAGYGPVIADIARQVTHNQHDSEWRYLVTDPKTGHVVQDGITQRRPNTSLRRTIQARDTTCVFPGCRMPSVDCDIDHTTRWADGGDTSQDNTDPGCTHHNRTVKEHCSWTYQRLRNGDYQWTSRLGHTYTTRARSP